LVEGVEAEAEGFPAEDLAAGAEARFEQTAI
jgi:hypothetical protein